MLHEHFLNIKKSKAKAGNMFRDIAKKTTSRVSHSQYHLTQRYESLLRYWQKGDYSDQGLESEVDLTSKTKALLVNLLYQLNTSISYMVC